VPAARVQRRRWCRERSSSPLAKLRRLTHRRTRGQVKANPGGRRDTGTDRSGEVAWRSAFRQDPAQNISRLFFHQMAAFGSPNAQALMSSSRLRIVMLAMAVVSSQDSAVSAINDFTAINVLPGALCARNPCAGWRQHAGQDS